MFTCEFYEISKNTCFTEHFWTNASSWFFLRKVVGFPVLDLILFKGTKHLLNFFFFLNNKSFNHLHD